MEVQLPEEQLKDPESEGESQILRGNNLPIVDLKNYNTEGKEAHYVQINQIIGAVTEGKKATEATIKKSGNGLHAGPEKSNCKISNGRRIKPDQTSTN